MHQLTKILIITPSKFIYTFYFLIFLSFLTALLELISIGTIIPIFEILNLDSTKNKISFLIIFKKFFKTVPDSIFIDLLLLIIFLFFLFKSIILYFSQYIKENLLMNLRRFYSEKLLNFYIKMNYEKLINLKNGEVINNINQEVGKYLQGFLSQSIIFISEIIIVIFLFLFLLYFDPYITLLTIFFISILGFLIFFQTKKSLSKWAKKRKEFETYTLGNLTQIFESIKEIRLYSLESFFISKFIRNNQVSAQSQFKHGLLSSLPRILLELISVSAIILGIYYLKSRGENSSLLTVAIFSLTLIRLIPSVSRIVSSAQHMKFFKPSIDIFFTDSHKTIFDKNEKKIIISDKKFNKSIKIKNISFLYKKSKDLIFEKFNLEIKKNDIVGIIGNSGSGKSTLISILTGLMPVCSGAVFVDNQNIKNIKEWWFQQISYVPQKVTLFSNNLIENIIVDSHKSFDEKKIKDILSDLNLSYLFSRRNKIIEDINTNKLSGGELQRIGIARALYKDSNVIFFDEITSSLDEKNEKKILKILKNLMGKKTIIITTHKKTMLKYCNKIIRL